MAKRLRVLHITTHDEECGIGKYQEQFLEAMGPIPAIENSIFEYSPNRTKKMSKEEFAPVLKQFSEQLKSCDILHIQHEFSFYSKDELDEIVSEAKRQSKKIIITVHTSLHAGMPKLDVKKLLSSSGLRHAVGTKRLKNYLINVHVEPMKKADLVLVHNSVTADSLIKYGVQKASIFKITMPVPVLDFKLRTSDITKHLDRQPGDIIFCTVGFLSENKGMRDALEALGHLPSNYKLAMIGGAHPLGVNDAFYEEMKELVRQRGLEKRVYITGYIKEDDRLNALIRECDVCVYPFDKNYYSGVTSASLNNSLANYKPAITYPTKPILEMNAEMPAVISCNDFNPTELVRELKRIDIKKQSSIAEKYAHAFSYDKQAARLGNIYRQLFGGGNLLLYRYNK
jgi:glycosyltransferase involved in cell wall biosynthesis